MTHHFSELHDESDQRTNPGLTNDLFSFSPGSMTWTSLSEQILGNPPTARYGHTVASTGKFLYLCGGINLPGSSRTCLLSTSFLDAADWCP